ncbi:MAG: aminoacyl--tRNA ligase-related protein [Candidatus Altiarchaeota archaeon]|nr:aminoacyl--tRNA ligase-related protein [Candidatus Altiarchaeota archaeon]
MKFTLDAVLVLSKPITADLTGYIKEAGKLLQKGAPEGEGARIDEWMLEKDHLTLRIQSGRYVRPHDAVYRIKNYLAKEMGAEYKTGVREILGRRYEISFDVKDSPEKEMKLPFVKEIGFENKTCHILLENLDESFLKRNYADRIINLINEKIEEQLYAGKGEHHEITWSSPVKKHAWSEDPTQEMKKKNWIKHRGRGQWIYGPTPTKIIKTMESIAEEKLIKPLGFQEVILPKAVTWDVWKRSGHAKNVYNEIYYLSPPKTRSREFWEDVIDEYRITGEIPLDKIKEKIDPPIGGMSYAQCPPLWPFFENRTLDLKQMPLKLFDRSGPSMRYESGGIHGIERVDEFHRIEIVWLGTRKQVIELHKEIIEGYKKIFNQVLDLEWRMAWVTPWFMAQEGLKGLADEKHEIGTVDFESYLPYKGSREDSEWLEFQNASNNGIKYPEGFNVKLSGGEKLYSGCTGIGLERWLATFLAQKGLNPENWPNEFRELFGEMPEEIRLL